MPIKNYSNLLLKWYALVIKQTNMRKKLCFYCHSCIKERKQRLRQGWWLTSAKAGGDGTVGQAWA